MKNFEITFFSLFLLLLFTVLSCAKQMPKYDKSSRATGWKMSGTVKGVKGALDLKGQDVAPGLVFIEGGSFIMGRIEDDIMGDWNNVPSRQHVQSFYMDETEVTNVMYLEYISWIKKVFPPGDVNYKNIYNGVVPDTLVWRNRLGYNELMVKNYLRHPAYSYYPVVGVCWVQAVEYCKWRTDRVNEASLEKNYYLKKAAKENDVAAESSFSTDTYLIAPTKTFGGNKEIVLKGASGLRIKAGFKAKEIVGKTEDVHVYAERSTGIIFPEYRLPTEAEWEYAAAVNFKKGVYNNYKGRLKYPWSGDNAFFFKRGSQLANFKQVNGDYGGIAGWSNNHGAITCEVKKYPPNDFGLYDMAGNVAEWVADVYRPIIDNHTNDFNYYRGNIFTKNKIGKDGKVELVTKENIKYDTLLVNGKIVALNFPGQIVTMPVDDRDTFLRRNFDQSYFLDYKDGDEQSTKYLKRGASNFKRTNDKSSEIMYNAPRYTTSKDSSGSVVKKYDKSNGRTTLIDDNSRVFKGGSWKDRLYWLSPSQRRYLSQDMATDYIGFRCAMSRVGMKFERKKN